MERLFRLAMHQSPLHTRRRPRRGAGTSVLERVRFMLHVTCDGCGKELRQGEKRFVVKIEVFAAHDPGALSEEDLDEDHMEAVGEMIRQMEESDEPAEVDPACHHLRYDLCPGCRARYLRDPLSREGRKLLF